MVIDWSSSGSSLMFQIRKQGAFCNEIALKRIERHREQSNALYAAGLIDANTLEFIRMGMLNQLMKVKKA